jgi:hypothetical protein
MVSHRRESAAPPRSDNTRSREAIAGSNVRFLTFPSCDTRWTATVGEDSQRLFADGQKVMAASSRFFANGWNGRSA